VSVEPRFVYREPLKKEYPEIAKVSEELIRCIKCGLCRAVCPTLIETVNESQGARGRVSLVEAVFDGRLQLSDIFDQRISTCLNCKACIEACPSGVRVDDIILAARAELVSRGRFPFLKRLVLRGLLKRGRLLPPAGRLASFFQRLLLRISPRGSALRLLLPVVRIDRDRKLPVFAPKSFRGQMARRAAVRGTKEKSRVAYFVGCSADLIYTNIAFSVVDVLERLGVDVHIPDGQGCCGMPVFNSGDFSTARNMALKNIESLRAGDVDTIVVSCSSCGLALKREYSKLLGIDASEISGKVMDVSEFIVKKVGLERLKKMLESVPTEGRLAELVVTYHDPCHLRRGQGVKDEPREIIKSIPGVVLREMRDSDKCCGGAGLYSFTHYEMSRAIAAHKVDAIVETGASLVLTGCASCIMQLRDALKNSGSIKVMHIVEFLSSVLKGEAPLPPSKEVSGTAVCSAK
jgi:glycolate oxidase iron-sulfur subunit